MPKKYRLTGEEMKGIRGKRVHGTLFSLVIMPMQCKHPKYAVVVSKKVSNLATRRNTVKRRVRAALQSRMNTIVQPIALVFYAKERAGDAASAEIRADIYKLIDQAVGL